MSSSYFRRIKATGSESNASSRWEFDFDLGKPAKIQKKYKWEAMPCDEVPKVYRVNHVKRLHSVAQNTNFEGQLPKLRYYHHIKKVEPEEVNNNKVAVSVKTQPITASSKKNGSTGQMKITGKLSPTIADNNLHLIAFSDFLKEKKRLHTVAKKKRE